MLKKNKLTMYHQNQHDEVSAELAGIIKRDLDNFGRVNDVYANEKRLHHDNRLTMHAIDDDEEDPDYNMYRSTVEKQENVFGDDYVSTKFVVA